MSIRAAVSRVPTRLGRRRGEPACATRDVAGQLAQVRQCRPAGWYHHAWLRAPPRSTTRPTFAAASWACTRRGASRGVGRSAGRRRPPSPAGPDHSPPRAGRLSTGGGERRPAGMDGGRDSRGAERAGAVGGDARRDRARRPRAGRRRGHRPRRRSVARRASPRGARGRVVRKGARRDTRRSSARFCRAAVWPFPGVWPPASRAKTPPCSSPRRWPAATRPTCWPAWIRPQLAGRRRSGRRT